MAELDRSISQFAATSTIPTGSLFFVSLEDLQSASGYESYKITSENVAAQMMTAYLFTGLNTTSKNVVGAINELKGTTLTGTLTTGQTSITFSDSSILATSDIEVYTSTGIGWDSITSSVGSVTITFESQPSDVAVKVVIK